MQEVACVSCEAVWLESRPPLGRHRNTVPWKLDPEARAQQCPTNLIVEKAMFWIVGLQVFQQDGLYLLARLYTILLLWLRQLYFSRPLTSDQPSASIS